LINIDSTLIRVKGQGIAKGQWEASTAPTNCSRLGDAIANRNGHAAMLSAARACRAI
jgi:hypothetical protein